MRMPSPRPHGRCTTSRRGPVQDPATCWSTRVEAGLLLHTVPEGGRSTHEVTSGAPSTEIVTTFPPDPATFRVAPEPLSREGEGSGAKADRTASAQPEGEAVDAGAELAVGGEPLPHPRGQRPHLLGGEAGPQV